MINFMWVPPHNYVCNMGNSLHKDYRIGKMTYKNLRKEYKREAKR